MSGNQDIARARPGDDVYGCTTEVTVALARAAKRAGVTLLAGTDFFSAESSPYPSLYEEIERLVTSDVLTPLQAIAAASSNPARAMGIHNMLGTIQAGKDASLVVLKSDPSRDIIAIRDVVMVFKEAASSAGDEPRGHRLAHSAGSGLRSSFPSPEMESPTISWPSCA